MPSTSRASMQRAAAATVLIVAGLVLGALSRVFSATEHHAFSAGAVSPNSAHVTLGKTYGLSTPGGVRALDAQGIDVSSAQCEWSADGSAKQALPAAAGGSSSKATNVVATFVAPYSGEIHVDCLGWGPMFLDNADDASADPAGWLVLLVSIALTAGVALALSVLRRTGRDSQRAAREDHEVERLVHAVHVGSDDAEIPGAYGSDVID